MCAVCCFCVCCFCFFFFKQKTAYEMRISDWSSDVCSSDLQGAWLCGVPDLGEGLPKGAGDLFAALFLIRTLKGRLPKKALLFAMAGTYVMQIGSASCRERVCQYV